MELKHDGNHPEGHKGEDYEKYFSPEWYLTNIYTDPEIMSFTLTSLEEIFKTGDIHGKVLLDFGTGPAIATIISASEHFEHIILSDYSAVNRQYLMDWMKGKNKHDWAPVINYVLKISNETGQGSEEHTSNDLASICEARIRQKVLGVLQCDARQANPLEPSYFPQFDTVISSFCLETAADDLKHYATVTKHIGDLVKPGGYMILLGGLEQTYYMVEGRKFYTVSLKPDDIKQAWNKAGFSIDIWKQVVFPASFMEGLADCTGMFAMVGKKTN